METRLSGNAFQILAAATCKARLPSLKDGTTRRLVPEERQLSFMRSSQHVWKLCWFSYRRTNSLDSGLIGADSTGATGACAPVLIKEPGQRSPFAPVTFRESTIHRLDCASTGVFRAVRHSVSASICPSRNASRRHPCRLLGVQYISYMQFTKC